MRKAERKLKMLTAELKAFTQALKTLFSSSLSTYSLYAIWKVPNEAKWHLEIKNNLCHKHNPLSLRGFAHWENKMESSHHTESDCWQEMNSFKKAAWPVHFKCTTNSGSVLSGTAFFFALHKKQQQMFLLHSQDFVRLLLCGPSASLGVFIVAFSYSRPALLVHHTAVLISSSIREHRLSLSLLTYSSEPIPLLEQRCADVQSIDGLSCCIKFTGKKRELDLKPTCLWMFWSFCLSSFVSGWLVITTGTQITCRCINIQLQSEVYIDTNVITLGL